MRINLFVFLGIFFFSGITANAQSFRKGIKVGVDVVNAFHNKIESNLSKRNAITSFNANIVFEYKGSNKVGFTMEPGFIRKGFSFYHFSNPVSAEEVHLDYIQLPVLFDYYVTQDIVLSVGPDFAIHLKKRIIDRYEKFELSAVIGARYNLSEHFDVGLRYGRGLTPSFQANLTDVNGEDIGKFRDFNQYFQLGIAYKF